MTSIVELCEKRKTLVDAKQLIQDEIDELDREISELARLGYIEDSSREREMLMDLREDGWSRADLGKALGVSNEYIRLLDRGQRVPSKKIKAKIRKIYEKENADG